MRVRPRSLAVLPAGIVYGIAVEWAFYDPSLGFPLVAADFAVGCVLIVCGVVAWDRRPESRVGLLMLLSGATWFLGNVASALLYLHRGPLVQLHLSYPTGRTRSRLVLAVIAAAYVDAAIEPLARNDVLTLALAAAVALTATHVVARASGPARKAGGPALAAALAFAGVLALGAAARLVGSEATRAVLWTYDLVIASVVIVLLVDLLRGRWTQAVVTGLVVDLGASGEAGTLRAQLARAVGDPSLAIGYRVAGTNEFVDDAGHPVELPPAGSGRTVTPLVVRDEHVAMLVHDDALLADPQLVGSVAAAAQVAVANAGLQAEARTRAGELEASRRRIVEAADAQRRRIEEELRQGAGRRLENVASLLVDVRAEVPSRDTEAVAALESELGGARRELEEFARGVHPPALTDGGLIAALAQLAQRSPIPVEVRGTVPRLPPPVEAALYFVCSEALANVGKHAAASRVTIDVRADDARAAVVVADDGVGGADPSAGSGLTGLADRVEALGGRLDVASPSGGGTRVVAEIVLPDARRW
jgi:signal transduction histidine kinase